MLDGASEARGELSGQITSLEMYMIQLNDKQELAFLFCCDNKSTYIIQFQCEQLENSSYNLIIRPSTSI